MSVRSSPGTVARNTRRALRPGSGPIEAPTVLLVDIGNTRLKWAIWRAGELSSRGARELRRFAARVPARTLLGAAGQIDRVLVSSVASSHVRRELARWVHGELGLRAEFARTQRRVRGLTTRYTDPWRLGVDRFLAALGARHLAGSHPACIVSVGTAVTVDFVDGLGVHRGGVILPSPQLMIRSLLQNTSGIGRRARARASERTRDRTRDADSALFARSTRAAIEEGARQAIGALIDRAMSDARQRLGRSPLLLITGGAAAELAGSFRASPVHVPDLVLQGLALYGGLSLNAPARIRPRPRRSHP